MKNLTNTRKLSLFFLSVIALSLSHTATAKTQVDDTQTADSDSPYDTSYNSNAPAEAQAEPSPLDWEWKKSQALEELLNLKLSRLVEGSGISSTRFRSNVVVLFNRDVTPAKQAQAPSTNPAKAQQEAIDFPELRANPMDLNTLVDKFRSDVYQDDAILNKNKTRMIAAIEDTVHYTVSIVSMNVALDPIIPADRAKALEQYIKTAFTPAFGNHLIVQAQPVPIIDTQDVPHPGFWELLKRFQKLALALLAITAGLITLLIWKLIPTRRTPHQLQYEQKLHETKDHTLKLPEEEKDEEEVEEPVVEPPMDLAPPPVLAIDEREPVSDAIKRVERQIVEIVKTTPSLSRIMIQDVVNQESDTGAEHERAMLELALLLETLAKFQISAEKFSVKPTMMKKFHEIRSQIAKIEDKDRLTMLEEVYWTLVSFSFLSEGESSFQTFYFLESLTDGQIARLIAEEDPGYKVAVLLGINEKRSARVLNRLPFESRSQLFELMCSGQTLDVSAMKELVERLRTKAIPLSRGDALPSTAKEGIELIAQMVSKLDFTSQFESVKALFSNAPDLRKMLKEEVFFAALLPEAKQEFIQRIFVDRSVDWMNAVIAVFGDSFRKRVVEVLPSMQRRMIETSSITNVSPAASMKALDELQTETRQKIANGELGLSEIFDFDGDNNSGSNTFEIPTEQAA